MHHAHTMGTARRGFLGTLCTAAILTTTLAGRTSADEGLWPMDQLPIGRLAETYSFEPDQGWIEHVQKSCVRFGRGASGSFVSPRGLVMTNHHVGSRAIRDLSDAEHDYIRDGFWAPTLLDELKCPNLHVEVLMDIRDITQQVEEAVTPEMTLADALRARRKAVAGIEKRAAAETGLHPQTVTLFGGARRHLYLYEQYHDVRLVMAPEFDVAFFGGDNANFEYPRHCLDVCFFRAYRDGKPAVIQHYFDWDPAGVTEGNLVFVAGHPSSTNRLLTSEHLVFLRDVDIFTKLCVYNLREVSLLQFMARGDEYHRVAQGDLLGVQNTRKALEEQLAGLLDERILRNKLRGEAQLRSFLASDPDRKASYGSPGKDIAGALDQARSFYTTYYLLETRRSPFGQLFDMARDLVRIAVERKKHDAARLAGYRNVDLPTVEERLTTEVPINRELERLRLGDGLSSLARMLSVNDGVVAAALKGLSPEARADQIIDNTRLDDVEYRRQLLQGGEWAVTQSEDPMMTFARRMDAPARTARKKHEERIQPALDDAYARIAKATWQMHGDSLYPDATGTLRLSIGTVAAYQQHGRTIEAMTTLRGAFDASAHRSNQPPFRLPSRWLARKNTLNLDTPFNFISTNDITGGNSGSPVLNRDARVVGVVFDGNRQGLTWDFEFDQRQGRAVSVDARAIIELLGKVYRADHLVDELLASRR